MGNVGVCFFVPALDFMVAELATAASQNDRVFLYGVGREALMLKALCIRLALLGLSAHFVFDMTTPIDRDQWRLFVSFVLRRFFFICIQP
ncbi:hypothetical protein ACOSQ2_029072 [Xanthoceras sorbifolium]